MCNPIALLAVAGAGVTGLALNKEANKKRDRATQATINAINQQHQEKVEFNKLANSVQTTATKQPTTNTELEEKLKQQQQQQKVPLNTAGTGVTTLPSTVGLNLGG